MPNPTRREKRSGRSTQNLESETLLGEDRNIIKDRVLNPAVCRECQERIQKFGH